jgi:hypothetical protein
MSNPTIWYCVVRSGDYRMLYLGKDRAEAMKHLNEQSFLAEGPNLGDAQRFAAIGAGKLTQERRASENHG